MLERPIIKTALRYGVLAAVVSFTVLLLVYTVGKNPYGQNAFYSLFLLPIFIFLGTSFYKKHLNPHIKFFEGLKFGWFITLIAAVVFSLLIFGFAQVTGADSIPKHIAEMKAMMEISKAQFLKLPNGQQAYAFNYQQLDLITPKTLVLDNFIKLLLIGFLFSLVSATFYRK
jgi:membrane protease YdiL (CAAX protease family)